MICCQFIFKPATYDDDFYRLDGEIDDYARSLPGFDRVEKWLSPEGDVVNAMYYFTDRTSVAMLGRFPQHRQAKSDVARWYDGYRIVVSDVRATYGDGRLPAPTGTSQFTDETPDQDPGPGRRPSRGERERVMTRPDKHDFDTLTGSSWSVHGGNHADETTGAIRTPIVMANSYRLPEDPSDIDDHGYQGLVYTREHGANQRGLEEKLARLDHGEAAAVFGTGMAALHAAFFTILDPGDHAIVSNVVYMRVAGLFSNVFPKKLGIEVDFVDITDLDQVRAAVRPNTKLVHTEVVANPDLRVADVPALAAIAHDAGALLTIDSTFTPPPMMRPLDHGADLVIHSLTKYYNGHGDAMGGVVVGARELVEETRTGAMWHTGGAISPFNAWLIMRGSITLPLRLQRQCENAQAVAVFLDNDPRVVHVSYPGLPGHDQHEAALAQLSGGFGGVVSFAIGGTHADRLTFVNDLRVITSAVSLGHDETLVAYEEYPEGPAKAFAQPFRDHGLVRLAIGLEAVQDLIADLDASLTTAYGPAETAS